MPKTSSLMRENPILLMPSLAVALGLEMGAIVQQIQFLLSLPNGGRVHNGKKWVWNTYEEWQRDHFPWNSVRMVKAYFQELERLGIVISCQPDGKISRKKYYRLNEGFLAKLTMEYAKEVSKEISEGKRGKKGVVKSIHWDELKVRIESLEAPDGTGNVPWDRTGNVSSEGTGNGPSVTETTTETTTKTTHERASHRKTSILWEVLSQEDRQSQFAPIHQPPAPTTAAKVRGGAGRREAKILQPHSSKESCS